VVALVGIAVFMRARRVGPLGFYPVILQQRRITPCGRAKGLLPPSGAEGGWILLLMRAASCTIRVRLCVRSRRCRISAVGMKLP
jgi:hypothetical protein